MVSKNADRKRRRFYNFHKKKPNLSSTKKFEFVEKLAEKWGKELKFKRTTVPSLDEKDKGSKCRVQIAFGDVPCIVFGTTGVAKTSEEAKTHCAWNLLSFFKPYLPPSTMDQIRKYWANAEEEIEEAVKVCRLIESLMDTEQFRQLRTVPVLEADSPERALAQTLWLESRRVYHERALINCSPNLTDDNKTISMQLRILIRYCWKRQLAARDAVKEICGAEGEGIVSYVTVWKWFKRFESGDLSLEDQPCSGPTNLDDKDQHAALNEEPSSSTLELATEPGVDN